MDGAPDVPPTWRPRLAARAMSRDAGAVRAFLPLGQRGWVPVTIEALRAAMRLNGVVLERNLAAPGWGRHLAHDPDAARATLGPASVPVDDLDTAGARRAVHLTAYRDGALVHRYTSLATRVRKAEAVVASGSEALARAVATAHHRLLAIEDEHEVARLHTTSEAPERIAASGERPSLHLAAPIPARRDPVTGAPRKRRVGRWLPPVLQGLAREQALCRVPLGLLGRRVERRWERGLIAEFEAIVKRELGALTPASRPEAARCEELHARTRGYGRVERAPYDVPMRELDASEPTRHAA